MNNENGENYKVSEAESKTTESKNKWRVGYNVAQHDNALHDECC